MENFTIYKKGTDTHYDTNECRFYDSNWDVTKDSKKYLEMLISNNPEKFEDCEIREN